MYNKNTKKKQILNENTHKNQQHTKISRHRSQKNPSHHTNKKPTDAKINQNTKENSHTNYTIKKIEPRILKSRPSQRDEASIPPRHEHKKHTHTRTSIAEHSSCEWPSAHQKRTEGHDLAPRLGRRWAHWAGLSGPPGSQRLVGRPAGGWAFAAPCPRH